MRINFRQGIINYPTSGSAQAFLVKSGSYVNLQASASPVNVSASYKDTEYLLTETLNIPNAWGPFPSATDCWLYWDINMRTGVRTFGYTEVAPIASDTQPTGVETLHWYDTLNNVQYEYTSGTFHEVVRVFAAKLNTNTFYPLGIGFPAQPYAGSQVGDYTPNVSSGHIIADNVGAPIRRSNGAFFTTESDFFVNGSVVNPIRIEATIVTGTALETMAKFQVVKFSAFGQLNLAGYNDIQTTTIAMVMDDLIIPQVGTVCVQGLVTNPLWNWLTSGAALWVSEGGVLTDVDPHVANAFVYPNSKPPIARVVTPTSIIFDQGLGGKGDRGEKGLSGAAGDLATTTTYGVARLATAPLIFDEPIMVGDNDTRLTNKVLKAGDTMTGPLVMGSALATQQITLFAVPTLGTHVTNKTYVDGAVGGVDLSSRVLKAGDTMTGLLVLSANPSAALGAATKQYVDTGVGTSVLKAGSSMTSAANLTFSGGGEVLGLPTTPTTSGSAASKAYVDLQSSDVYNTTNVFTANQAVTPVALTDGATVNVNAALSNNFRLVIGGNRTLANPTNLTNGTILNFFIKQDGVGGRTLAYGSKYDFGNAGTPTLTATANGRDLISCYYDSVDDILVCSFRKGS